MGKKLAPLIQIDLGLKQVWLKRLHRPEKKVKQLLKQRMSRCLRLPQLSKLLVPQHLPELEVSGDESPLLLSV